MRNKRKKIHCSKYRCLSNDTLPFEVPLTFGNSDFIEFLNKIDFSVTPSPGAMRLAWEGDSDINDIVISILFGFHGKSEISVSSEKKRVRGRERNYRFVCIKYDYCVTAPFHFCISHKDREFRELTIIHPRNQILVANFYNNHHSAILYLTSKSPYSIRAPFSVAKTVYFKDATHYEKLSNNAAWIETEEHEYEKLGSFFKYKAYDNIHKFYESAIYLDAESKFDKMIKLDISKCFDSIYTHSITWAILGKENTKDYLEESKTTFGDRFDRLMQSMNRNETNGIVIGPEFSRIFAEIILQKVDLEIEEQLRSHNINIDHDYKIFRYLDDYFIFINDDVKVSTVLDAVNFSLRKFKLSINSGKTVEYKKPILTELTVAKLKVRKLLAASINLELEELPALDEAEGGRKRYSGSIYVNRDELITSYKALIKETDVTYSDLNNYTLSAIERKSESVIKRFMRADSSHRSVAQIERALHSIIDFSFFVYLNNPKVSHTIKLCRILSIIVDFMKNSVICRESKSRVYNLIFRHACHVLKKNTPSTYRQVDTIYILSLIRELGRNYWVDERALAEYISVRWDDSMGMYVNTTDLNYLSITSILHYINKKARYNKLRSFLESYVIEYIGARIHYKSTDAELTMLIMDMIACPFVSNSTKDQLCAIYGISNADFSNLKAASESWFTSWGHFNYRKALDQKRSHDVY